MFLKFCVFQKIDLQSQEVVRTFKFGWCGPRNEFSPIYHSVKNSFSLVIVFRVDRSGKESQLSRALIIVKLLSWHGMRVKYKVCAS